VKAQNCVGGLYSRGRGVTQVPVAAFKWCERAAKAGSMTAAYNVGSFFAKGEGVARDDAAAVKWL
jgi:TPR repeat protein